MTYIDGFVLAVPTANKQAFVDHAQKCWEIFKDHGCRRHVEAWGDDVPEGKVTSFPMAVQCGDDETVVFSFLEWESKEARDAGMKAIMDDPRMKSEEIQSMPLDGKRMIMGSFSPVVDNRAS